MGMDSENLLRRLTAMYPLWTPVRQDRTLEWATATTIVLIGAWLMLPFDAIHPWIAWGTWWFSELWLGVAVFASGVANLGMLLINGSRGWTPIWRARTLGLSMPPLGALFLVAWDDDPTGFGVALPILLIALVALCIRRAAADAIHVEARRDAGLPSAYH